MKSFVINFEDMIDPYVGFYGLVKGLLMVKDLSRIGADADAMRLYGIEAGRLLGQLKEQYPDEYADALQEIAKDKKKEANVLIDEIRQYNIRLDESFFRLEYSPVQGFFHFENPKKPNKNTNDYRYLGNLPESLCKKFTEKMFIKYPEINTGKSICYPSFEEIKADFDRFLKNEATPNKP